MAVSDAAYYTIEILAQHIVACCISNEGYNQTHLRLNFSVVTGLTAFILARQCGVLMQTVASLPHTLHYMRWPHTSNSQRTHHRLQRNHVQSNAVPI